MGDMHSILFHTQTQTERDCKNSHLPTEHNGGYPCTDGSTSSLISAFSVYHFRWNYCLSSFETSEFSILTFKSVVKYKMSPEKLIKPCSFQEIFCYLIPRIRNHLMFSRMLNISHSISFSSHVLFYM